MEQEGAITDTILWQDPEQPSRITLRVRVKLPTAPAVTVQPEVFVALVMEPLPEMDQL